MAAASPPTSSVFTLPPNDRGHKKLMTAKSNLIADAVDILRGGLMPQMMFTSTEKWVSPQCP